MCRRGRRWCAMLLMKKQFFDAIRSGRKTTTVRLWKRQMARAGEVHTMPGLGKIRIDDVRKATLAELTDADAVADGFESAADLIAALREIYPNLDADGTAAGRTLYAVYFTYPAE